jgi:hypothetical protein
MGAPHEFEGNADGREVFHIFVFEMRCGSSAGDHADGLLDQFSVCGRHPRAASGLHT